MCVCVVCVFHCSTTCWWIKITKLATLLLQTTQRFSHMVHQIDSFPNDLEWPWRSFAYCKACWNGIHCTAVWPAADQTLTSVAHLAVPMFSWISVFATTFSFTFFMPPLFSIYGLLLLGLVHGSLNHTHTHTHNRFTAGLEYVRVHPGQQVPER